MAAEMQIENVPVSEIEPNPYQPREAFEEDAIEELADSIEQWGLLQPITLRSGENGTYQIIAGERRWRAAQHAGVDVIPAIVKDASDEQQQAESLIENVHREDLSVLEKGRAAYQIFLTEDINLSPQTLAGKLDFLENIEHGERDWPSGRGEVSQLKQIQTICHDIGRSKKQIREWLNAISVPEEIQQAEIEKIDEERLSGRALARIASIDDEDLQREVYEKAVEQDMSGKTTSKFVTKVKQVPEEEREMVLQEGVRVDVDLMGEQYVPEIPEAERERILAKVDKLHEETEEILSQPEVQKRGELRRNWQAHSSLLNSLGSAKCPVCGAGHENLKWECHDITIKEAQELARQQYQESVDRR